MSKNWTELSDYEKGQINALHQVGFNPTQISRQINRPCQTIRNYLKREKERGTHENLPRSGRPKALDSYDKRHLVRATKSNRRLPLSKIHHNVAPQVSSHTIRCTLAKVNINKWRAIERPTLTKAHATARLGWTQKYKDWMESDWKCVIWSDECKVERGSNPRVVWVFHMPVTGKLWHP